MKKTAFLLGLIILLISNIVSGQGRPYFYSTKADSLEIGGIFRSYLYHIPKDVSDNPKIIFVLHGSTMTAKQMVGMTGFEFNILADSLKDVIIVYPQGYDKYWNDCRKSATYKANTLDLNEMDFFKGIISKLETDIKFKHNSVFVAGYSNGGHMVYKLAKENPDFFKAFAVISANLPVDSNNDCFSSNKAVSILIANGTSDPVNPFNGGSVIVGDGKKRGEVIPTFNCVQYWKDLMKDDEIIETRKQLPDLVKDDNSTAVVYSYKGRYSNKKVELVKINNGGHIVPNPKFTHWPQPLGNVNKDINLPKLITNFFLSIE